MGKYLGSRSLFRSDRNTPTSAGKADFPVDIITSPKEHPQIRGEDLTMFFGVLLTIRTIVCVVSIFPVITRKTICGLSTRKLVPVYPRMHGEDYGKLFHRVYDSGVPPHARGRPKRWEVSIQSMRRTPTHVGKTQPGKRGGCRWLVYPHVRGEDSLDHVRPVPVRGVPPRTWGRRKPAENCETRGRCTPTYVGKTLSGRAGISQARVYPHVRGEDP